MRDVTPPPAGMKSMGPVDEIRAMTLTDFRRLGPTAAQSGPILLQKFMSFKEESPMLYLSALQAWPQSPLFRAYAAELADALAKKQKLAVAAASTDKVSMTLEEIKAIIEVNKKLNN